MSAAVEVTDLATVRTRTDPVARARALAPLIAAAAPRIEAGRALTPEVLDALHGAALFRTLLPRAFNGEEVEPATFVRMQEVIAAADASTGWCLGQASGCSMAAAYMAPEVSREIWGRDPRAAVAWGMGNGTAEVVDGGYRVTGTWRFASGSEARHLDRRPLPGAGTRRQPALRRRWPADRAHHDDPQGPGRIPRCLERGRAARHRQRHL